MSRCRGSCLEEYLEAERLEATETGGRDGLALQASSSSFLLFPVLRRDRRRYLSKRVEWPVRPLRALELLELRILLPRARLDRAMRMQESQWKLEKTSRSG